MFVWISTTASSSCLIASGLSASSALSSALFFSMAKVRNVALKRPVYASEMWANNGNKQYVW